MASVVGAGVGSLALTWLLYLRVLPTSGAIGFAVAWYLAFLGVYVALSAFSNPGTVVADRLVAAVVTGGAALVGAALVVTIGFVFVRGWPALHHLNFYVDDMSGVRPTSPLSQGGVLHAVIGSGIEIGIAVLIALPLGIATAVYMTEVGGRLTNVVRTVIEAMTALPDVLAGLFVYTVLIIGFHWERDGFAVSLALAVTMTPVVARSAEVVLKLVPDGLREAGLALGASHWRTVRGVVLPTARPGLATSLILGVARIAGETAPLLIVSGASTFFNKNPFHNPMNSLPLFIFASVRSGEPQYIARGYGAAALLVVLVLALFAAARFAARNRQVAR
ncbi:MAG: phosphate ABC transporter permease PstA [Actinobacteria bacterium]|nr:phosphate ABC transporter permease PstA [Actinomycetota bacterium]MBV9254717.1 phosphate ABC transporter permease PstA [Actinomycetota bacterium]MBV9662388.1 phosphate ABC transporter permease PstA [Actinomycetota bacterium]MBV9934449.1 phosphate ABC transporter permease PstA [Actinomycetota bacterium]